MGSARPSSSKFELVKRRENSSTLRPASCAVDKEGCPIARSTRRDVEADTVANAKFRRAAKMDRSHADRACEPGYRARACQKQALPARCRATLPCVLGFEPG